MLSLSLRALLWTVAAAALVAGLAVGIWWRSPPETASPAPPLQQLTLADLEGRTRVLSEWRGSVLLVNFWATWCAPCREEIPLLNDAQARYAARGLQIVGVAIDDPADVAAYARQFKIAYPVLVGDLDALGATEEYGNPGGLLPYTIILASDGRPIAQKVGAYRSAELDSALEALFPIR